MNAKAIKICLAASAGGHLMQLLKVAESWHGYDVFYVSTVPVVAEKLRKRGRTFIVGECNRQHPVRTFMVMIKCLRIAFKERPDVVVSSGAAAGCVMCFLGKLFGAKVIWIDSITNVERISLSGRMVRYIADLFLVQWPDIAMRYRNVEYVGEVI